MVPTKKAHIISDFALKYNKQHQMQESLFSAYFSEGQNINLDDVLEKLASEVGLDPKEAMVALSDPMYIRQFEEGIGQTKLKGIHFYKQVPFFWSY